MRRFALALAAVTLAAATLAGCHDAAGPARPPLTDQAVVQLARAAGKVTICHAAGRADDPKFVELTVSENAARAHLDEHGTPQAGHEQDYLVTDRTPCPPPEAPGQLSVCKVGAAGIPTGTPFTFVVNGETVTVSAGQCVMLPFRVGTRVDVAETAPANTVLVGLTLTPAAAGTVDPRAGTASVVVGTDIATLTFTNRSTLGQLKICKVAGSGIAVGTNFSFTATPLGGAGVTYTVPAGPAAQGGFCVFSATYPVGTRVTVQEAIPAGALVSAVSVAPADRISGTANLPAGTVSVVIGTGFTDVTFTNVRP